MPEKKALPPCPNCGGKLDVAHKVGEPQKTYIVCTAWCGFTT